MENYGHSMHFYGIITSGNGISGRNTSFDNVLADHKEVHIKRRSILSVADPEEEEQEHDHVAEQCDKNEDKESNIKLKSQREFSNLSDFSVYSANRFTMKHQDDKQIENNWNGA